ncbi:MAG TPA: ribose-phosphate diphosphokinase [Chloroflexi bacterium]|jgi:ribose-phosphate pyrophosphokinase|nr:ribose-phosphate diphosphokinase [Chloroflexota bacterium]
MDHGERIYGELALVAGSGNPELAQEISSALCVPLLDVRIEVFPNENIFIQLLQSVRSKDVFIIQPTCSPVHDNLMELLIMIDTVRRASAGRITAVIPYFSYARSDKKDMPRVPITARLVADMVGAAGADRFMTVDLHAGQIQGFFNMPGDELSVFPLLVDHIRRLAIPNLVVVAADLGFAKKARNFAEAFDAPVAFVEKRREGSDTHSLTVIGDVHGRNALIVDDEVDQGGTMVGAAHILRRAGARDVYACFVHPTFSPGAVERLAQAAFAQIVCTNTEPIPPEKRLPNMHILHLGRWIASIIDAVHRGLSVGKTIDEYRPSPSREGARRPPRTLATPARNGNAVRVDPLWYNERVSRVAPAARRSCRRAGDRVKTWRALPYAQERPTNPTRRP